MEVKKLGDIYEFCFEYSGENWEQFIYLSSDIHYDSVHCDRQLLKSHYTEAKKLDAPIFIFGDVFDCMQGRGDPRSFKSEIRPEYAVDDYFNEIGRDAARFFRRYPVAFVAPGNHEESVLKHREIDLTKVLSRKLKCVLGEYSGWFRVSFRGKDGGGKRFVDIYYNHEGGAGPVSLGVIQTNRNGVNYQADIYVTAHNHNRWQVEKASEKVNEAGEITRQEQLHINSGTYNMKPKKDRKRFDSKYGQPGLGGVFLRFRVPGRMRTLKTRAILA